MNRILTLSFLILSLGAFAQSNRGTMETYDCRMANYSCYGNSEVVQITAYSYQMAETKCESMSERKGKNYCGVDSFASAGYSQDYNTGYSDDYYSDSDGYDTGYDVGTSYARRQYRCQLTTNRCAYNGGRYGVYIYANNLRAAQNRCRSEARRRHDRYCTVWATGGSSNTSTYRCYISSARRAGCNRPNMSRIQATSMTHARRVCINRARDLRRRFCRVTY